MFLDEKDNYVQVFFTGMNSVSKQGVELTVPVGAKKMHITNNGQTLTNPKNFKYDR